MSCSRHEDSLLDAARGAEGPEIGAALAHAATCVRCATWLDEQRSLTALLARERDRASDAPLALPDSLRSRLAQPARPRRAATWLALSAAAAVAGMIWAAASPAPPLPAPRQAAAAVPVEMTETPVTLATPTPAATPRAVTERPRARPRPASVPAPRRMERASSFVPVPYAQAWGNADGLHVVRVEMPRAALARFGWPSVPDGSRRVTADVLMGSDGMARAVRLVEPR